MRSAPTITPTILEALYEEALTLSEAARAQFTLSQTSRAPLRALSVAGAPASLHDKDASERLALSCEALRTTTRLMHAMAWLLNFRAYFNGEVDAFQLRRFGRLPAPQPASSQDELAALSISARAVVEASCTFYARLSRLDQAFYHHIGSEPATLEHLHSRIGSAFAAH